MGCYLDLICSLFILGASTFSLMFKDRYDSELLAFTLQILTDVVNFFSFTLRMGAEIENYFTSAQRLHKYTLLESEDLLDKEQEIILNS